MKYQLYVVSCSGGFYPALNSTPPTESLQDTEALEVLLHRLRPGHGRHYSTVIVRVGEDGSLDTSDIEFMQREADILSGFYR